MADCWMQISFGCELPTLASGRMQRGDSPAVGPEIPFCTLAWYIIKYTSESEATVL